MNLKALSDQAILDGTHLAAKDERRATSVLLHYLLEVNERRLFGPKYPSLHEFVVNALKYSAPAAQRRINAMRVLKVVPEVIDKIESGALNLTTLSQAQVFFRQERKVDHALAPEAKREVLSALESKSTRQVDRELIGRATEPAQLKSERVRVVSENLAELKCLVTDETLESLEKLKGLLSHKDLSMGELLGIIAKAALKQLDPAKEPKRRAKATVKESLPAPEVWTPAKPAPEVRGRYVAAKVKREVWRRTHGKCALCGSAYLPQIDHIQPFALGGSHQSENLRLLCFHCNQREADRTLGRTKMASHRT